MAEDIIGMFNDKLLVSLAVVFTSMGKTSEGPGRNKTSSNVSAAMVPNFSEFMDMRQPPGSGGALITRIAAHFSRLAPLFITAQPTWEAAAPRQV
jgi:hypothetical protein